MHTRKIPIADDVNLSVLARGTPGFSGADLANMVNEAALSAARQNRKAVLMFDFELAKDKVLMGVERKSLILTEEEKKVTAYHEAGHALVAAMTIAACLALAAPAEASAITAATRPVTATRQPLLTG